MSNYALNNEIKSLLIDVSEEIENKNLKKFIFTSLKLNNFEISKNDFMNINFISELNKKDKTRVIKVIKNYVRDNEKEIKKQKQSLDDLKKLLTEEE